MAMLETRFEHARDMTYRANAAVRGARLVRINAQGDTKHKPRVVETSADDGSQHSVGGVLADKALNEDVTVVNRGVMKLISAAAITAGELVYPASAGRVRGAAAVGATALAAGARPFGVAFHATAAADENVWVKPIQSS